jgi:hypothetical protein
VADNGQQPKRDKVIAVLLSVMENPPQYSKNYQQNKETARFCCPEKNAAAPGLGASCDFLS